MTRRHSFLLLICSLVLLSAFGFGCKKTPPPTQHNSYLDDITPLTRMVGSKPKQTTQPQAPQPAPVPQKAPDQNLIALKQAVQQFGSVKSFRASLVIPTAAGSVTGTVEFARGTGLHGMLNLPEAIVTEIYLLGNSVLFRANTSTWTDLSGTTEGKQVADLFQNAFSVSDGNADITIPADAQIIGTGTDPSGCRLFIYAARSQAGTTQVCVKNGLPIRFLSQAPLGNVEVSYRDFNQPIRIQSPLEK
ncbi:MAG TPA: hypothetical protein VFQ60_05135 [Patescibacteria group bacterium]|nr:hypothetical protein [Patescibacteria group bacterium]